MEKEQLGKEVAKVTLTKYEKVTEVSIAASGNDCIELVADLLVRLSQILGISVERICNKLLMAVVMSSIDAPATVTGRH